MRYVVWVLRLLVFVLVLLFALKNTGPVDVHFYADYVATGVPLIVVMLAVFVIGVILGLLVAVPAGLRRRREISRLRREVERLREEAALARAPATEPVIAPEVIAPLAPL